MEFFQAFNEAYIDFIDALRIPFPELQGLDIEQRVLDAIIQRDGINTKRIYHHVNGNCELLYRPVHTRDAQVFCPPANDAPKIALLSCSHLYEIWPHFTQKEQGRVWKSLECLIQFLSLFEGTANNLDKFRLLANSFVKECPNITPANLQKKVFSSMFTNKTMANEVRAMMTGDNMRQMQKGFGHILRGLNIGNISSDPEQTQEQKANTDDPLAMFEQEEAEAELRAEEEALKEARKANNDDGMPAGAGDDDEMTRHFRELNLKEKRRTLETKKDKKTAMGMKEVLQLLETQEIGEEEQKDISQLANSVLGDSADPTATAGMQRLFELLGAAGSDPHATQQLNEELKQQFGISDSDAAQVDWSMLQNMTGQVQNLNLASNNNMSALFDQIAMSGNKVKSSNKSSSTTPPSDTNGRADSTVHIHLPNDPNAMD